MRLFVSFLIAGAFCALVPQEAPPDFVWQGKVDGIALLHLRAEKLEVQIQEGAPVADQRFRFSHPVPDTQRNARLRVLAGRGYVHIVEQPRIDNGFTLTVSIEDRQPGSSAYSIALSWDSSDRAFERPRLQDRTANIDWNGRVDQEALVSFQGKSCVSTSGRGAPVAAEHFKVPRPLPNQPVHVTLLAQMGRGDIRLVEQPSEANHYTARVSIRDPLPGSSDYSFKLEWDVPAGKKSGGKESSVPPPSQVGRALLWSGAVTGRVQITVQGGASFSQALDGGRIENGHADILTRLPARSDIEPVLKVLSGRGRAQIVERPSEQNHYQLVLEITDPGPGSGDYQIELDW